MKLIITVVLVLILAGAAAASDLQDYDRAKATGNTYQLKELAYHYTGCETCLEKLEVKMNSYRLVPVVVRNNLVVENN